MSTIETHCTACTVGMPALRGETLQQRCQSLGDGWRVVDEHHLERQFTFDDFQQALAFTNRLGALAEAEGHHPEIHLAWGRVGLTVWTYKAGGLTENDFVFAEKVDHL